ncbi:MAG TPA: hypothetical protein EYH44_00520 [Thermoprotei archaeon]|nr:hypothetical protein [Thermoprotei archaeon]
MTPLKKIFIILVTALLVGSTIFILSILGVQGREAFFHIYSDEITLKYKMVNTEIVLRDGSSYIDIDGILVVKLSYLDGWRIDSIEVYIDGVGELTTEYNERYMEDPADIFIPFTLDKRLINNPYVSVLDPSNKFFPSRTPLIPEGSLWERYNIGSIDIISMEYTRTNISIDYGVIYILNATFTYYFTLEKATLIPISLIPPLFSGLWIDMDIEIFQGNLILYDFEGVEVIYK